MAGLDIYFRRCGKSVGLKKRLWDRITRLVDRFEFRPRRERGLGSRRKRSFAGYDPRILECYAALGRGRPPGFGGQRDSARLRTQAVTRSAFQSGVDDGGRGSRKTSRATPFHPSLNAAFLLYVACRLYTLTRHELPLASLPFNLIVLYHRLTRFLTAISPSLGRRLRLCAPDTRRRGGGGGGRQDKGGGWEVLGGPARSGRRLLGGLRRPARPAVLKG